MPDKSSAEEILKFRKEIDILMAKLNSAKTKAPEGTEELAHGADLFEMRYEFDTYDDAYIPMRYSASTSVAWDEIFGTISPLMIDEASEGAIRKAINLLIGSKVKQHLSKEKKVTGKSLSDFSIHIDDFHTIKIQMRALGLITKSESPRSVKDRSTYWTLTPYGDTVLTRIRAIKK